MRRSAAGLYAAVALVVGGCGGADAPPQVPEGPRIPTVRSEAVLVDTLVAQLEIPWGVVQLPDGRWLVSERPGRVRLIEANGTLRRDPLLSLDVHAKDPDWHPESGLMGMALHPDFASNGYVYVVGTFRRVLDAPRASWWRRLSHRVVPPAPSSGDLPFENRILRFTLRGDSALDVQTLVRGLYTNHYHAGGALAVGPDRKLYTTLGDGRMPPLASDLAHPVGKVLRYELDGRIPADNPDSTSAVWASGLRNSQGLAWLPDGTLLGIEHGPSGLPDEAGQTGHDELNVLERGANYGWPSQQGRAPLRVWTQAVAPSGLLVESVSASGDSAWIVVGKLLGGVERIALARHDGQWRAVSSQDVALPALRRVRSLWKGADGFLYASTSNRDIRGVAYAEDDLIVRIQMPAWEPAPPTR